MEKLSQVMEGFSYMKWLKISTFLLLALFSGHAYSAEELINPATLKGIIIKSAIKTSKTTFNLSIYKDGESRGEFQGISAFKAPESITFKLLNPFGLTIFDLIGNDNILQIYIPSSDELYQGNLPRDLWLIFGILEDRFHYVMEEIEDYYILYLLNSEGDSLSIKAKFFFDKLRLKQRRIDILKNGKSNFRVEIDEFMDNFPLQITLYFHSGISITIKHKEVKTDEIPSKELFSLKDTRGREVKELERILSEKTFSLFP